MNTMNAMELTANYEEKLAALKAEMSMADKYIEQDNNDLIELENEVNDFLEDVIEVISANYHTYEIDDEIFYSLLLLYRINA